MFHMLTCFDLEPGVGIGEFRAAYSDFVAHLRSIDMVVGTGPVGRRQSDTPMDTDSERDHQYFVIMTFRDRAQVDATYAQFLLRQEPTNSIHHKVQAMMQNPVFICWQDIE